MKRKINLFSTMKKKGEEENKDIKVKNSGSTKRLVVSLAIAVMFFVVCLILLKNMTMQEEQISVMVTAAPVPENIKITEENAGQYFTLKEVPVSCLPDGTAAQLTELIGAFTVHQMGKNEIVTQNDLSWKAKPGEDIEDPIEISVGVSNLAQVVGGKLREGDIINISRIKQLPMESGAAVSHESEVIAAKAYITDTFTNAGVRVASEDKENATMIVNILLPASAENDFNKALADGSICISKVCE